MVPYGRAIKVNFRHQKAETRSTPGLDQGSERRVPFMPDLLLVDIASRLNAPKPRSFSNPARVQTTISLRPASLIITATIDCNLAYTRDHAPTILPAFQTSLFA